jgi:N-acetylmuramoyl-L-alanine amidase/putative methionine-R-sulfoxide reductase with GAF domain
VATTTTNPNGVFDGDRVPEWPRSKNPDSPLVDDSAPKPTPLDALQVLLAFSALHEQVRHRKALAGRNNGFDSKAPATEFEPEEQFVLDEVLNLVAERAVAITGADGLAIALAENNEIVLRASAGSVRPDVGARIDRDSAFSGACFKNAQIFICDDTETDPRVNVDACRKLGARSMVAVPLCGRKRVIGLLEAFSTWPFSFNESDVRNLTLLAELVIAALKPEDEDRFALSAQVAATKLEAKPSPVASNASPATSTTPPVPTAPVVALPVPAAPTAPVLAATTTPVKAAPAQPAQLKIEKVEAPQQPPKPLIEKVIAPPAASGQSTPEHKPASPAETKSAVPESGAAAIVAAAAGDLFETPKAAPEVAKPAEPELTFGKTQDASAGKGWMVLVLVGIVIVACFAAGVFWKLKTSQLGNQVVQNEPAAQQPTSFQTVSEPASTNASPATTSDAADTAAPGNSAAAPQELSKFPRVTGVRHWSSTDSSTVVLDLEDQVQYEPGHLTNPDRVYFDLRDTQLAPELVGKVFDGDALLSRIRIAQPVPGMTRIVLEAKGSTTLSRPQVSLERDPYRLVIEVTRAGATPKGSVDLFPSSPETNVKAIVIPPPSKEDLQWRAKVPKMRIVVDAGHGGWDLGTVGRQGLLEKDLVLEISERLGKLLESRLGSEVVYTRQDDNYIPLDNRAQIANDAQADLFVSIHANYSDLPSARGVETYYSNFFAPPGSKEEKDAGTRNTDASISSVDLHDRVEQSRRLAASVQRSLYGTLSVHNSGLRDRGIKEAGFVVLTESAMPGILAEVSFVSSPTDEQKLRSDGYRERIAEALYRGIARYAVSSKGIKVASAAK